MRGPANVVIAAVVTLGIVTVPSPVLAQKDGNMVPLARRLFKEGVKAARADKWDVALDRFARAYKLAPRPKTLFNLAGAQMKTKKLVAASEGYRKYLRDTAEAGNNEYRRLAKEVLAELEQRIPTCVVEVSGVSEGDTITIGGNNLPRAGLGEKVPVDPGRHAVVVRRAGVEIGRGACVVEERKSSSVQVVVTPAPKQDTVAGPAKPAGAVFTSTKSPPPQERDDGDSSIFASPWFWTAAVVVVGGAATGGYFLLRPDDPTEGTLGRGTIDF